MIYVDTETFFPWPPESGLVDRELDIAISQFAPGSQTVSVGQIHSTARIRLDDPLAYARDWRLWQVRLSIGNSPDVKVLSLPAPQPPPGL